MGAFILYVGTFFAMAIGLIIAVHRTITAEERQVAEKYNESGLFAEYEHAEEPTYAKAA
jgi:hypothetical protein